MASNESLLLVSAGESGLSCGESLIKGLKRSAVVLSYEEDLVLSMRSGGETKEMEVGARDCASVAGKSGACPVQDFEDVVCLVILAQ